VRAYITPVQHSDIIAPTVYTVSRFPRAHVTAIALIASIMPLAFAFSHSTLYCLQFAHWCLKLQSLFTRAAQTAAFKIFRREQISNDHILHIVVSLDLVLYMIHARAFLGFGLALAAQ
jgi:hypothetical protein